MDFKPNIELSNKKLDLVEKTNLLGIMVSSDLSWENNTDFIVQRCNQRIWILRRLKKLGARINDLLDVFKQIRSIAEYAVPVWNFSLTGRQIAKLERIQKTAFHVILGRSYTSYSSALKILKMKKLSERRGKLCLKFALKCEKHSKFKKWFKPREKNLSTRNKPSKYTKAFTMTKRFEKSPLPYLTDLLNLYYRKK